MPKKSGVLGFFHGNDPLWDGLAVVLLVGGVGAGVWALVRKKPKVPTQLLMTVTPGTMIAQSTAGMVGSSLTLNAPTGGTLVVVSATDGRLLGQPSSLPATLPNITPQIVIPYGAQSAGASGTITVGWEDPTGTPQQTAIPLTLT